MARERLKQWKFKRWMCNRQRSLDNTRISVADGACSELISRDTRRWANNSNKKHINYCFCSSSSANRSIKARCSGESFQVTGIFGLFSASRWLSCSRESGDGVAVERCSGVDITYPHTFQATSATMIQNIAEPRNTANQALRFIAGSRRAGWFPEGIANLILSKSLII